MAALTITFGLLVVLSARWLAPRQQAILDDVFNSDGDEQTIRRRGRLTIAVGMAFIVVGIAVFISQL